MFIFQIYLYLDINNHKDIGRTIRKTNNFNQKSDFFIIFFSLLVIFYMCISNFNSRAFSITYFLILYLLQKS